MIKLLSESEFAAFERHPVWRDTLSETHIFNTISIRRTASNTLELMPRQEEYQRS